MKLGRKMSPTLDRRGESNPGFMEGAFLLFAFVLDFNNIGRGFGKRR